MPYVPDLGEAKAQLSKMRNPGRGAFGDRLLSGATPYPIFATDTFTGEVNLNLRDGHQIQDARQVMCLKEVGKYEANAPGWSSLRANALRSYASRADAFIIGRGPDGYPITSLDVPNAAELGRNRALTHARHRFNPDHRRAHSLAQSEGGSRTRNVLAAEDWPQQATAAHAAVLDQVNYARSVSSRAYPDQWPATTSMLASSSRPSSSPLAAGTRIERAQTPPVSPLALSAIVSSPLGDSQKVLSKASSPLPVSQSTKHRKRRPQVAPAPYADRI